jgi:hypothetical protein
MDGLDAAAEFSEFPSHSEGAFPARGLADRIPHTLVQSLPDQTAKPMGDHPKGLRVSPARDAAAVEDGEEAHLYRGVGCLIEKAAQVAVALGERRL